MISRNKPASNKDVVIGVDCGMEGGIVALDIFSKVLVDWFPMPLVTYYEGLPHVSPVDVISLSYSLEQMFISYIAVEVPRSIPNLNKASNIFRQGCNVQAVIDCCLLLGLERKLILLNEREWQPESNTKKGKDSYLEWIPTDTKKAFTRKRCRVPHKGAVDAYLMAKYTLETSNKLEYYRDRKEVKKKPKLKKNWKF